MKDKTQIRGDKNNPHHLSVGAVLIENSKVYLIKKPNGYLTLPRETMFLEETLIETLKRGCEEEMGIEIEIKKFLGTLVSHFKREDGTDVEKTTLYFSATFVSQTRRKPKSDEVNDEVIQIKLSKALEKMKSQSNKEYKIIEKLI
jgi:ADP-ribose pyrophosphatase YjhB (NUDIX family)